MISCQLSLRRGFLVAGSGGSRWFDQEKVHFFVCDCAMFDAFWHDVHFSGAEGDRFIPEFDNQRACEDEAEIVGVIVLSLRAVKVNSDNAASNVP
jgi:hypothetical protein